MAGGKDIKFGHDKRPISTFTNTEQNLFNYQTGQPLVDESGNPLITEQEEFFLNDATRHRLHIKVDSHMDWFTSIV